MQAKIYQTLTNGGNDPDPYAVVVAVDQLNRHYEKCTVVKSGTNNPYWNQELDFGHSSVGWRYFTITIYDSDDSGMTPTQTSQVYTKCCRDYTIGIYARPH